ncbi:Sec-independent protein translocase protein TatB [Paracoccus xiamenensis]|uniref:Sec-independent protein translocase protein TatB n=1 Tax=Paracoccus xiamenensis TaxID=2714901 RepID=UPI00140A49B6|nr:Sec-independent protein translocase protein TatB [Paracoccus xiamenensis]NHF74277.1 twin-arginine translocase subunit TatB [Paracoccus xiamenensis]
MDIGWSELLLIGVVALIVIGPRDLPHMFRALGRITGKMRTMAREFSSAMEDAARDTGLNDAANSLNEIRDVTSKRSLGIDALDRAADRFEKWDPKIPSARAPAKPDPGAAAPAAQDGATPASASAEASAVPPAASPAAAPETTEPAAGQRRLHAVRRSESKDA